MTPTGSSTVRDVEDLKVWACDPPEDAVRVTVAGSWIELYVEPTTRLPRTDLVVWSHGRLLVRSGYGWGHDELPLAKIALLPHTACVVQAAITDVRAFRAEQERGNSPRTDRSSASSGLGAA